MDTNFDQITQIPLLSIIVPNYNNAQYLEECIDSILCQTFQSFEIIIADDCSEDSSIEIIQKFIDKNPGKIKGVFHSKNSGVSYNRHSGILASKGQFVTSIDSDDYYYSIFKLEKEIDLILHWKIKHNNDVCAFSNSIIVAENKEIIRIRGTKESLKEGDLLLDFMGRSCEIPINYIVDKRIYYEVGGFDFGLVTHEDWDLKIRIASKYDFYFTDILGTAYRKHNRGLSSIDFDLRTDNLELVFNKNIDLLDDQNDKEIAKKRFGEFLKIRYLNHIKKQP